MERAWIQSTYILFFCMCVFVSVPVFDMRTEPQCESIHMIPHEKYTFDYDAVVGQCCENVVG